MEKAEGYIKQSQATRTVIRQVTCPDGYCLIVEDDTYCFDIIKELLNRAGIVAKLACSIDEAISKLHQESESIICAIIGNHINRTGTGADVIREIENEHSEIPYVVYTSDNEAAAWLASHFPRANVILKGSNIAALASALGVKN